MVLGDSVRLAELRVDQHRHLQTHSLTLQFNTFILLDREAVVDDTHCCIPNKYSASWIIMLIVLGSYRSYGIFFMAVQERFQSEASVTALIGSMLNASYSVTSIIVSTIGMKYLSHRQLVSIGGVLLSAIYILTAYSSSVQFTITWLGFVAGIGQGFIMAPTTSLLGLYFEKYRSLANAISVSGGGVGSLLFSLIIRQLLNTYGFTGTMLIIAGMNLNIFVAAALMRPPSLFMESVTSCYKKHLTSNQNENEIKPMPNECPVKDVDVTTSSSIAGIGVYTLVEKHSSKTNQPVEGLPTKDHESPLLGYTPSEITVGAMQARGLRNRTLSERSKLSFAQKTTGSLSILNSSNLGLYTSTELSVSSMLDLRSNHKADEKSLEANAKGVDGAYNSDNKTRQSCTYCPRFGVLRCDIMRRIPFLIFLSCACGIVLIASIQIFLPPHALDSGLTARECDFLITVIGFIDLFAVLGWGFFADRHIIRRHKLISLAVIALSIATFCIPALSTKPGLIAYSVIYGIFIRVYFSLYPVLLVDILGVENLGRGFGVVALVTTVFPAVVQPFIGFLRDSTQSFIPGLLLIASMSTAGALGLLTLPLGEKCERQRNMRENGVAVDGEQA
ncbi:monocarboxylate transporter 14-like isoform X3 [Dreissena polymorpha]|uniref:monocarboxylate transporter 14-like isoform X3 n=1 Tax=Dreissena polymorpha TaxID=45954 RepID=UPI002264B94A|nr:monocarboxylate transporter 14-like isoform X3 [Dreissena polymorpha]